jgi:uncharacterized protein (DUF924 family)
MSQTTDSAATVVRFWLDAGPGRWFKKESAFDDAFRERFAVAYDAATGGELDDWTNTANGALALLILLDQYPRNSFRGTARMFASDAKALAVAESAIHRGIDLQVDPELRIFFYSPFIHSERLQDQQRALELYFPLGEQSYRHAVIHHDIIARFGRFPHRNPLLGRTTTVGEQQFLDEGGFAG